MAFTDNCDLYAAVHIIRRHPSQFNCAAVAERYRQLRGQAGQRTAIYRQTPHRRVTAATVGFLPWREGQAC
jgi:hypothetical protein